MKISIIYHLYNKYKNLDESLESILKQDSKNYELILIFDSPDVNIIEKIKNSDFYNKKNIRIIKFMENHGRSFTYNFALEHAKGEYVYFAESKNIFKPNFVSEIEKITKSNNNKYDYINFLTHEIKPGEQLMDEGEIIKSDYEQEVINILNTKITIKNKVFRTKFLKSKGIKFVPYKNYAATYLYNVLVSYKKAYNLNKFLVNWKREAVHFYEYNLYNIIESAELLIDILNKRSDVNEVVEVYKVWIPILILYNFLTKIYFTYFKNEKILKKSIENAVVSLDKIYPNYKHNKYLSKIINKDLYNYIINFDKSISTLRNYVNRLK